MNNGAQHNLYGQGQDQVRTGNNNNGNTPAPHPPQHRPQRPQTTNRYYFTPPTFAPQPEAITNYSMHFHRPGTYNFDMKINVNYNNQGLAFPGSGQQPQNQAFNTSQMTRPQAPQRMYSGLYRNRNGSMTVDPTSSDEESSCSTCSSTSSFNMSPRHLINLPNNLIMRPAINETSTNQTVQFAPPAPIQQEIMMRSSTPFVTPQRQNEYSSGSGYVSDTTGTDSQNSL